MNPLSGRFILESTTTSKLYSNPNIITIHMVSNGKAFMPLSVTVHHATTDGYYLKVFFEELQHTMHHPEERM